VDSGILDHHVQYLRLDHRGLDALVPQKFLGGSIGITFLAAAG
jgi:hypothetical protein